MKYLIIFPFVESELDCLILNCIDDDDAVQRAAQHACWFLGIDPNDLDTLNEISIAAFTNESLNLYNNLDVNPVEFNFMQYLGNNNANH